MQATHLLLGRPWQYDRGAVHDGRTNYYRFRLENRKFLLKPLSPAEVHADQQQMKANRGKQRGDDAGLMARRFMLTALSKMSPPQQAERWQLCSPTPKQSRREKQWGEVAGRTTREPNAVIVFHEDPESSSKGGIDPNKPPVQDPLRVYKPLTALAAGSKSSEWGGSSGYELKPKGIMESLLSFSGML
ncbi:unnamed protein product [Linum trigynum]|uniref:1-phosphatidylinositol 4-kinase n=1 Tax=Linum trigynum TaxID=586398 RepID=A0AAV2F907_9ROSI